MPAAVLGYTLHPLGPGWRFSVNHRQQSAGFERPKEARVDFGRLGEVMIHEPHEDGITTLRRKIRLRLAGLQGGDVFLLRRKLFQVGQLFGIEFRGVDPPCRAHALGGGESHLSPAGANVGHDAALLPVEQQGQTVGFLLVGVLLGTAGGNNERG